MVSSRISILFHSTPRSTTAISAMVAAMRSAKLSQPGILRVETADAEADSGGENVGGMDLPAAHGDCGGESRYPTG